MHMDHHLVVDLIILDIRTIILLVVVLVHCRGVRILTMVVNMVVRVSNKKVSGFALVFMFSGGRRGDRLQRF